MKRNLTTFASLGILTISSLFFSCNNTVAIDKQDTNSELKNDLLPEKVIVYNEVNFKSQPMEEWTGGVDSVYMESLNHKVLDSDIKYYSSNVLYDPITRIEMNKKDVLLNMDRPDAEGISALYFVESWSFSKANYQFNKMVESWSPVYVYDRIINGESLKAKKLLYDVWGNSQANEKTDQLIAENMTYEVNFVSEHETNEFLNLEKLMDLIVMPVVNGEKKAYDFYEHTEMPMEEILTVLGHSIDSVEEYDSKNEVYTWTIMESDINLNNIQALIFVEDWYMDEVTFTIRKKVKSIAPVILETFVDEDEEVFERKRIAFKINLLEKLQKEEKDHKKS